MRLRWHWAVALLFLVPVATGIELYRSTRSTWDRWEEEVEKRARNHVESVTRVVSAAIAEAAATTGFLLHLEESRLSEVAELAGRLGVPPKQRTAFMEDHGVTVWLVGREGEISGDYGPVPPGRREQFVRRLLTSETTAGQPAERYGLACGLAGDDQRLDILCSPTEQHDSLRRHVGLGALLGELQGKPLAYVALQAKEGILAATPGVERLKVIDADPFLRLALGNDEPAYRRMLLPGGEEVFEGVIRLSLEEGDPVLLRIALDASHFGLLDLTRRQRNIRDVLITTLVTLLAMGGVLVFGRWQRSRRALAEEVRFSDEVLEQMEQGLAVCAADGRVLRCNRGAQTLLGEPPTLERWLGELVWPAPADRILELQHHGRLLQVHRTPLGSGKAHPTMFLVRDVTEQRETARREEESRHWRGIGRMAATVAHEIRNPLNTVVMLAQRLEGEFQPADNVDEYLRFTRLVRTEADRVERIVQEFLALGRPLEPRPEEVNIGELMEEIAMAESVHAAEQGKRFELKLPPEAAAHRVVTDPDRVRQVLVNLIANAREAAPAKGTVTLTVQIDADSWHVVVVDKGPGMDRETTARALEPFFTTRTHGTGLGLPLAARLTAALGGTLHLDSAPGQGTRASIRFPNQFPEPPAR